MSSDFHADVIVESYYRCVVADLLDDLQLLHKASISLRSLKALAKWIFNAQFNSLRNERVEGASEGARLRLRKVPNFAENRREFKGCQDRFKVLCVQDCLGVSTL